MSSCTICIGIKINGNVEVVGNVGCITRVEVGSGWSAGGGIMT